MIASRTSAIAVAVLVIGVSACGGQSQSSANAVPQVNPGSLHPSALIVKPSKIALIIGERHEKTFVVEESGYKGSFNTSETFGCIQAALLEPSVGMGPKTTFTLTGLKETTAVCTITFSDTKGHKANFKFTVT